MEQAGLPVLLGTGRRSVCRFTCPVPAFLLPRGLRGLCSHLFHQSVAASPLGRSGHEIVALRKGKWFLCISGSSQCDFFFKFIFFNLYFSALPLHFSLSFLNIMATARQISAYHLFCKLQIEFSCSLCRPNLSDDFIAFMESFVVWLFFIKTWNDWSTIRVRRAGSEQSKGCRTACSLLYLWSRPQKLRGLS